MTTEQRIQWIALPAGSTDDGGRRLAVFVAPRLRSDEGGTLATYPDFVSWTATVAATTWQVSIGGVDISSTIASRAPDDDLWAALFPAETVVRPYEFDDYADLPMVTFGVGGALDTLRGLYTRVAAAAVDDLPRRYSTRHVEPQVRGLDELLEELREVVRGELFAVREVTDRHHVVASRLAAARDQARARRELGPRGGQQSVDPWPGRPELERALFFHSRPEPQPREMPADGEHYRQGVDFHQMISALGNHRGLLRRLGLVVDLRLEPGDVVDSSPGAPSRIRVTPTLPPAPPPPVGGFAVARVAVVHDTAFVHADVPGMGAVFTAAERTPDPLAPPGAVPTGLIPLPESRFRLEQVDVDGAVLKAVNLAATVYQPASTEAEQPLHQPDIIGLPALRTGGLLLVQTGRADALQSDFSRTLGANTAVENGDSLTLFAEDLVRGHRLDVLDATRGTWRSLHERTESVTARGFEGELTDEGEGFVQLTLAGPLTPPGAAPDPHAEVYVHETLITWDGWSLSAPRVGASLSRDPRAPNPEVPETEPTRVANDPETTMGMSVTSSVVPGSLPRLRFGRPYRVRMRTVDLAGNGPTLLEADTWLALPAAATSALPAATAAPYLRFEPVPAPVVVPALPFGEGASLLRLVIRSNGGDPAAWAAAVAAGQGPLIESPHVPYEGRDERHVAPPKASFELAERHGMFDLVIGPGRNPDPARLAQVAEAYELARREKGTYDDPEAPGAEVVLILHPLAHPGEPARSEQRYVVNRTPQLDLPYLPDPLAEGAVFFGLPGAVPPDPTMLMFEGPSWHEARPLRLHLAGGDGPPAWDSEARVLTVRLAPSATASARVASLVTDVGLLGIFDWCDRSLGGHSRDRVITAMKENRSWLLTPWHQIEFVHAVQQPMSAPQIDRFEQSRVLGQTSVDLVTELRLHVPSTEKIDVLASWDDAVDDPAEPRPRDVVPAKAVVFDLPIATAAKVTQYAPSDLPYSLVGGELLTANTGIARSRQLPTPAAHQFGDTKHRSVTYTVQATTAFREYFPPEWAAQAGVLTRSGLPQTLEVPSSAPPMPPNILYATPTLWWEDLGTPEALTRVRHGGGVRIWLERGWWSSGAGERLGVVFGPTVVSVDDPQYRATTFIGQDPIRAAAPVASPTRASFTGDVRFVDGVKVLDGLPAFELATYDPVFDETSNRWYCDIDLDTGAAYLPLLRLALVRYQPCALEGCATSTVVLVDLVQTLPDRTLTVTHGIDEVDGGDTRTVTVVGPSYTATAGPGSVRSDPAALSVVRCKVQRRTSGGKQDALAWVDVPDATLDLSPTFEGAFATWTGSMPVPPASPGTDQHLLIVEEDRLAVDEQTPSDGGFLPRVIFAAEVAL